MNPSPSVSQTVLKQSLLSDVEKSSKSILMQDIFNKILTIAKLDTHVIVIGEIGSGKKRLAQIIHENGGRADGPFHTFYCVDVDEEEYKEAFREQLHLEEEHFILKYNAIEKACDGILYLDQFSELPPQLMLSIINSYIKGSEQLYRYNQENKPRLVISMNQESYQKVLHKSVWKSLLQKLDPVVVMVPPLRERKEDIPVIIDCFLNEIKERYSDWKDLKISTEALKECFNYNWPGNIRQLKNALLQGAILSYGETIESHHLPFSMNWKLPYEFDGNEFLT
ncbi:MAG: sigma 54-interacting transcriptional regulator [Balneolaceae bacterium]